MRDHLTEELISAYIDGELAGDERQFVERVLRESAEHRQLCEDLRGLRSAFAQLPKFRLPQDFHLRVVEAAEQAHRKSVETGRPNPEGTNRNGSPPVPPGDESESPAPVADHRSSATANRKWLAIAVGVSAVAAAILAAVALNNSGGVPPIVKQDDADQVQPSPDLPPGPFRPDETWFEEQFVYYLPKSSKVRTVTMVVDVGLTERGLENRTFEEVFRRARVPFDPEMALAPSLEQELLETRPLGKVKPLRQADTGQHGEVELIYVICETRKASQILEHLQALSEERDQLAWCFLDMLYTPRELELMYKLNRASAAHFAQQNAKNKRSLFHRLVFSMKLSSGSRPELARMPTPSLRPSLDTSDTGEPTPWLELLKQAPTELLFVVHKPKNS